MKKLVSISLVLLFAAPAAASNRQQPNSGARVERHVRSADRLRLSKAMKEGRARRRKRVVMSRGPSLKKLLLHLGSYEAYSFAHSLRVAALVEATAAEMGYSDSTAARFGRAALVHDLGKLSVSLKILADKKPRSSDERPALTKKQFRKMKRHTVDGVELLERALDRWHPDFKLMRDAMLFHHEKLDGTGYRHRREIPFISRLIAVADVYDALTGKRSYKKAKEPGKAMEIIKKDVGAAFDPRVFEAFERVVSKRNHRRTCPAEGCHLLQSLGRVLDNTKRVRLP